MREGHDDVELLAQQSAQLVLRLCEPARGERRTLRVERIRLALRQRRQFGRPGRARSASGPPPTRRPAPRRATRRSLEPGRTPARDLSGASSAGSSPSSGPRSISTSSRRRSAAGKIVACSTARSARCVNGENARICSISSPKNSMRSGSRPVVANTSTRPPRTANWPAFFDPLDPLVSGGRELLGERVDPGLVAGRDADDSRPLRRPGERLPPRRSPMRRRDRRARAPRERGRARRRDAAAARDPSPSGRRATGTARRSRLRGTSRPPPLRHARRHPRAAARRGRAATRRAGPPGRAAAPAPRRGRASAAPRRAPGAAPLREGVRRGCRERAGP